MMMNKDKFNNPNQLNLFGDEMVKYIYESPDGGETIYRRKFNDHENGRELIKDKNQTDLFPLKS